jgi:hexosaminidase
MNKSFASLVLTLLFCVSMLPASALAESTSSDADGLSLIPQPKELQLGQGGFRVKAKTRIIVQRGHQSEDRIAAETLAEEVSDESGLKLNIVGAKSTTRAEGGSIMLVRLQDRRVRRFLARKGLKADGLVGEEGYLLFSDKSHLIVAASSGQGLFSGVQMLRQLLRTEGKAVICPAVEIRDWPNLDDRSLQDGLTRDTPPAFPQLLRGPRS